MPETCAALAARFPAWTVSYDPAFRVFCAELRRGTQLRFMVARKPSDLAAKIEQAEAEAAAWVTVDSGPDYYRGGS